MKRPVYLIIGIFALCFSRNSVAQTASLIGKITEAETPVAAAHVQLGNTDYVTLSDSLGNYSLTNILPGTYQLIISHLNYDTFQSEVTLLPSEILSRDINLSMFKHTGTLDDVVISGTMKAVRRLESPVPVEVYTPAFFKKNPTPNIFEALQNINGVRPQLNCNICNTGDIHINGLEGPYTMVLIDGMPVVSALGTVYGLSGIPNGIVERIEIVKGPASSLYGSEAVGGLINIITRSAQNTPRFSADIFGTTWGACNADLSFKFNTGKKINSLIGINYFNFQNRVDNNHDNFTDVTLQHSISIFQKWHFDRKDHRIFTLAGRYLYEDRWGGDMRWNSSYRGGDEIYGESIYTNRAELFGNYQLPVKEKLFLGFSLIMHDQDSRYGTTAYLGNQKIGFGQFTWDKTLGRHDLLTGLTLRYTFYDDNTPATATVDAINHPEETWLPGIFVQDEISLSKNHKLLLGFRYDHNNIHGNIFTPRIAYKWPVSETCILRLNTGTGFRVVNLFTEDHAALTGARVVIIQNDLKPEKSYNVNLNFYDKMFLNSGTFIGLDATAFYTYFLNRIIPDYKTDPNAIIYDNLEGYAVSKGISLNADLNFTSGLKLNLGGTLMGNTITERGITQLQMLTEKFTATWTISYKISSWNLAVDYTGNIYSPMQLPLLSDLDPRRAESPWWSIQNIQFTYDGFKRFEIYAGIKNLLNWTPNRGNPFIIARAGDPFDRDVIFDAKGQVVPTTDNPYALTFDPSYVYAPNQGIRGFLGWRFKLN